MNSFVLRIKQNNTTMLIVLLLLLPGVRVEEQTPSKFLINKNSLRGFEAVRFLKRSKPNKKGPILFPNDGPPPPPTPLIVTSRPLIESIRRSELNPNNTQPVESPAQTQVSPITSRPEYLDNHRANSANLYEMINVTPLYDFESLPYSIIKRNPLINDGYDDYDPKNIEAKNNIPVIYRGLTNPKLKNFYNMDQINASPSPSYRGIRNENFKAIYDYQPKYISQVKPEELRAEEEASKDYINNGENFAFSYTVKDDETGDDFSHSQKSSGSTTSGEYRVKLPDGRTQIVSYTADENGYKADVRYNEENEVNDAIPIDLKSIKEKQNDNFNDRYIEHRVDQHKKKHSPAFNLYLLKSGKDNIYFDYGDKHSDGHGNSDYLFTDPNYYFDPPSKRGNIDKLVSDFGNIRDKKSEQDDYYSDNEEVGLSKEYKDYSTENDYLPHKSKYLTYIETNTKNDDMKPGVTPSYDVLKDIFVKTLFQSPQNSLVSSTITPKYESEQISNFVSSTAAPSYGSSPNYHLSSNYESSTTEKVVYIGTKKPTLFTNIKNILGASSGFADFSTPATPTASVTPSSYLFSTIASLKNKLNPSSSPYITKSYIDRINKYISY